MGVKFLSEIEINNEDSNLHPVEILNIGDKILPYNELTPEGFEHLLYAIYNHKLHPDDYYDRVTLMVTGADKGRDVWLTKNETPTGLIQCKREVKGFDAPKALKEIIKFLLFAHLEPQLLPFPQNFKYTLALSSEPASTTVEFFTTPNNWLKENSGNIDSYIQKTIDKYKSFSKLSVSDVSDKIQRNLKKLDYELCRPVDLNQLLDEAPSVRNRFFISNNNIDVEELTRSITQALIANLPTSLPGNTDIIVSRISQLSSIKEVPLPKAIASRTELISNIVSSLKNHGTAWVYGAAGVGKTISAKMAAKQFNGNWVGINLRGLNAQETRQVLSWSLNNLNVQEVTGILIDDLECDFEPIVVETLLYAQNLCNRANIYILFTSSKQSDEEYLYSANLPKEVEQKIEDFSEDDLSEILAAFGVNEAYWAKYIYLVSGGGHPQLAIATIQSMQHNKWDIEELRTLKSLLKGNEAVEKVRSKTRQRLLRELPTEARRLIERLSLVTGRFKRHLVLDLAQLPPVIMDGGTIFDQIIGSWIDQHETDRFSLSPLLSNYAAAMLTKQQKKDVYYEIANSLVRTRVLDPIAINSAFIAAWAGENTGALSLLCIPIFTADINDLQMIAPHLIAFSLMSTDNVIYEQDSTVNLTLRGAQLILLSTLEDKKDDYLKAFKRFEIESENIPKGAGPALLKISVYSKLLLSTPKFGSLPNWGSIVKELDVLLESQANVLPEEISSKEVMMEIDNIPTIGFLLFHQVHQIKLIEELIPLFEFLDSCRTELRDRLFLTLNHQDFSVDMFISGAWLNEYNAGTIDCENHSGVLAKLEDLSNSWGHTELAVCFRKYAAIIWDETGGKTALALELIEKGFEKYGDSNFELIRAKAKILYRAKKYGDSLLLTKNLIDAGAPFNYIYP